MKYKNKIIYLILIILLLATSLLGIGYAQIADVDFNVVGDAQLEGQDGIIITNVVYSSNNNANVSSSKINTYYQTMLNSKVVLGNTLDSSITYEVTILNQEDNTKYFDKIIYDSSFYDNNDIVIELNGLSNGDDVQSNESVTFYVTFKYDSSLTNITNNTLNSYINFLFVDNAFGHTITYDSSIPTAGYNYPTSVDDHGTVSFYFQGTKPSKVFVDGNLWKGYNMNTGRLVLDDITSDIVVSADFTPVNRAYFANNLSSQMKTLAGGASNVTAIRYSDTVPSGVSTINVRKDASSADIFMWYDNGIIYWNSACLNPTASGATLYQLFSGYSNLADISGLETWDTSEATTVLEMFKNDVKLVDASPLRYMDTSSITNMRGMFNGATLLSNITGFDNWDVSNVQDMNSLFVSNYSLVDISPLATWDTRSVKSASGVLQECRSLVDISALTNWNTSSMTEIVQLLQNTQVSDLTPISNWDVSNVKDMRQFLFKCTKVTSLEPLLSWQTNSLLSLNQAFAQMNSITNFHGLENWDVSHVTNFSNMCDGCTRLNTLEALQNWNVSSGTNFAVMFYGNSSITAQGAQYINGWTLNPAANFSQMFNRVNNKPTFMFDVGGVPTPGTWSSDGTLIVPS